MSLLASKRLLLFTSIQLQVFFTKGDCAMAEIVHLYPPTIDDGDDFSELESNYSSYDEYEEEVICLFLTFVLKNCITFVCKVYAEDNKSVEIKVVLSSQF